MDNTLAVILAGGVGSRLNPLTKNRAKPAVPFGGKYRIIDFTLSNCLHSGLRKILVLTQYKSHSLNKHLRDGWSIFNPELGEYITAVPPQMRTGNNWYMGTADAIFQNCYLLERSGVKYVVILSGDHIYRMDYAPLLSYHQKIGADVSIACMEVDKKDAHHFGIVSLGENKQIVEFEEKPKNAATIPNDDQRCLASMGIYVFNLDILLHCLDKDFHDSSSDHDFGKNIIPDMINESRVFAYSFGSEQGRVSPDRYWRDVGTLDSYYQANMDLLKPIPPMNLYQDDWPVRSYSAQFPPARTTPGSMGCEGIAINSIISSGVVISGGSVQQSILFNNVFVGEEAVIENGLLFDGCKVGKGAKIRNCIVDKYVQIPNNMQIGYDKKSDRERFTITENGIVVVSKLSTL